MKDYGGWGCRAEGAHRLSFEPVKIGPITGADLGTALKIVFCRALSLSSSLILNSVANGMNFRATLTTLSTFSDRNTVVIRDTEAEPVAVIIPNMLVQFIKLRFA